ncbi:hypothetical protein [Mucilaginibacter segetis]|uniref:Uncharacterized protein n=1 Tax=Mucilaginibacter segetis TaxID=2793071 RepID=A0A934PPT1_9SPHI|nr:hypothetical protein [Mucilaginibacter segetis]MBK0378498.1 hypothetical protein [Mucilaginibacter segetis]
MIRYLGIELRDKDKLIFSIVVAITSGFSNGIYPGYQFDDQTGRPFFKTHWP